MRENLLKKKLQSGQIVTGPFLKLTDPAIVEIAGLAGFDFVIIDTEHGPISIQSAQNLIRSAENKNITPVVRVAKNSPELILRALDIGAQAVQIPQICSKADALRAVESSKFYPIGKRGLCRFVRASDYSSAESSEYFNAANRETLLIVHIEGIEGIENLADILEVEGIDVVFLGPYDLSQSCGIPGQVNHPEVAQKMQEAVKISRKSKIVVGTFVDSFEDAEKWIKAGVQYISYSVDTGIIYNAFSTIVKNMRC
jgi:4-hydroxy-2-oxoheptanedioate aldolase